MAPEKAALYNGNINSGSTPVKLTGGIRNELLENDIAYLDVPWLSTADNSICTAFADSLQQIIGGYDQQGIKKWIIDLRRNTGGNCWPMLAGLAPLLGNGTYGYFVSDNEKIPFSYLNGVMMQGKHERCTVTKPYVSTAQKKIVILTSAQTASAGEIVALAFKGLPDVYVYGEPTAGLTTANATYSLSDGYLLVLTVCKEADRSGRICEGKIQPDQLIVPSSSNSKDAAKKLRSDVPSDGLTANGFFPAGHPGSLFQSPDVRSSCYLAIHAILWPRINVLCLAGCIVYLVSIPWMNPVLFLVCHCFF